MPKKKCYETTDVEEVEQLQREGIKVIAISSTTPQIFTLDIEDKTKQKIDETPADTEKVDEKKEEDKKEE